MMSFTSGCAWHVSKTAVRTAGCARKLTEDEIFDILVACR